MHLKAYLDRSGGAAALAARLGVSPEAVRLWAEGKRTPRRDNIAAIVKATEGAVTADDLLGISEAA